MMRLIKLSSDRYGRRKAAAAFSVIYSVCCFLKLAESFWLLLLGRLLGGISTSLLFSVFESWYVSQHVEALKLDPNTLADTFAASTRANGLLAICAGVTAETLASGLNLGPAAPFLLAVPCFGLSLAVVLSTWDENFGDKESHLLKSYKEGLTLILSDGKVLLLGLVQSAVESSMYTFVFLWTPVLTDGEKLH